MVFHGLILDYLRQITNLNTRVCTCFDIGHISYKPQHAKDLRLVAQVVLVCQTMFGLHCSLQYHCNTWL